MIAIPPSDNSGILWLTGMLIQVSQVPCWRDLSGADIALHDWCGRSVIVSQIGFFEMTLEISCSFIKAWEQPSFTKTRLLSQLAENLALWSSPPPAHMQILNLSHQSHYFDPFLYCRQTSVILTGQSKDLINGSIWTSTCYLTCIFHNTNWEIFYNFWVLFLTNPVSSLGRTVFGVCDWHFFKQWDHCIPLWLPLLLIYIL